MHDDFAEKCPVSEEVPMISVSECKKYILSEGSDPKLMDLYMDAHALPDQKERYAKAIDRFVDLYGDKEIAIFSAPGRSEVMGNHTDHQHGEIVAASINLDAIAIVHPTDEEVIKITSGDFEEIVLDAEELAPCPGEENGTKSIIKGVVRGFLDREYQIGGLEAYITSDVLIGAGLSSSAAFEVLIGTILSELFNEGKVSAEEIAVIGQFAENVYFGKPCGLMDQMACSVGGLIHVDFADPQHAVVEKIDFDLSAYGYSLCITDTQSSHDDLTEEYAAIPSEMKSVAGFFGREYLLGTTLEELIRNASELRTRSGDRAYLRALHFVTENERVKKGVQALKDKDLESFLRQVRLSGRSSFETLQNVYVSSDVRHQNVSVALALSDAILDPVRSADRVHGGGFAGTIQAFVPDEDVEAYQETMDLVFGKDACKALKIRLTGGTRVIG